MGNLIGKNSTETINWNNINTDDMSTTDPNLKGISRDAANLINHLQIPPVQEINSEVENIFKAMSPTPTQKNNESVAVEEDSFSDTSPFISSDMYKYLMDDTKVVEQAGGANNEKDSSTSSSSSSVEKKGKERKKETAETAETAETVETEETKETDEKSEDNASTIDTFNDGSISYISSSAHTEGKDSDLQSSSNIETSISLGNNNMLSNSINTSDINMVTSST